MSDGPEERLLARARSPEDAAALARFDERMALPLVLAAVLPLAVLPGSTYTLLAAGVNIAAWLVFLADFVVHERRLRHYLGTWLGRFDLSVVVLTAPWFLLLGPSESKFVLLIRLARIARVLMATRGARRLFERLGRVALVAVIIVFLGAAVAYRAEHPTNPGFATYGDALWWGIVTLTTVGYGDIVPKTTAGRVVGVMIMITGISVLGLLAGSLASFFRLGSDAPGSSEAGPSDTGSARALTDEIAGLRVQVAVLVEQVSKLLPRDDDGPQRASRE